MHQGGHERRYAGRPAAPGLAAGPLVVPEAAAERRRAPTGDPAAERAALRAAIEFAAGELTALSRREQGAAADILEFQVAMLGDEALAEPAFAAIAAGTPADTAWRAALDAEIAGYESAEDEAFRARAADLADLRDRVLNVLRGGGAPPVEVPAGAVVVADELPPSRFLAIDWSAGGALVLADGSPASHVAMLARARGVPMVVGLGERPHGRRALVDGTAGTVIVDPTTHTSLLFGERLLAAEAARRDADAHRAGPAITADGERVRVLINIASPDDLAGLDPAICDGIGLVRSEFLTSGGRLPDEAEQLAAYTRIVRWAAGRPVTIRTLDAGGDKPIAGLTLPAESNPALGLRGIRLSLARPEVFRTQLRALARAAAEGDVRIMLPMVAVPAEFAAAARLLDEEVARLAAAGVPHARPPLGMMIEVPAAALTAERFPAAFYSIGSNDLAQYTLAAARDVGAVADLLDAGQDAVLALIRATVAAAAARGVEVALCGDAAADLAHVPALIAAGLRALSVPPVAVGPVKQAIAKLSTRTTP